MLYSDLKLDMADETVDPVGLASVMFFDSGRLQGCQLRVTVLG